MKRILSCLLVSVLLLSLFGSALADTDYTVWEPAWDLSQVETLTYKYYEPSWPIANGDTTISVVNIVNSSYYRDPEDTWFWPWAEQATGLKFDVRNITNEALSEQKSLMFAGNDLPDVMIGMKLTTGELMRYGVQEGQLMDLTPYFNEETMPWLTKWFEGYPIMKALSTTPDGKVYTLPYVKINSDYYGSQLTQRYNMVWLKEVYPDLPELPTTEEEYYAWAEATKDVLPHTLDEFTALLYKFKELHPDSTPYGGVEAKEDSLYWLLNAFGYLQSDSYGSQVTLRNGEVVIPAIDDTFYEYLKLVHQYYEDGIIAKDYFTADALVATAQVTDDKIAVGTGLGYSYLPLPEDYHKFDALYPLTSQWSDTPRVKESNGYGVGGCVLSAKCANPEAALKFLDFFYSDLGIYYLWETVIYGSPDTMGKVVGFYYADGAKRFPDVLNGSFENSLAFVRGIGLGQAGAFGNRSHSIEHPDKYTTMMETLQHVQGTPDEEINRKALAYDHGDNYYRICSRERVLPYVVDGYPYIVYYSVDEQETIDEITLILNDFIKSSVSKFITGATELTEENFKAFVDECKVYGADELLEIYKEGYANYLASLE